MRSENVCVAERELIFLFLSMFRKLCGGINGAEFGEGVGALTKQSISQYEAAGEKIREHNREIWFRLYNEKNPEEKAIIKRFRSLADDYVKKEGKLTKTAPKTGKIAKKTNENLMDGVVKSEGINSIPLYIAIRQYLDYECSMKNEQGKPMRLALNKALGLVDVFSESSEEQQMEILQKFIVVSIILSDFPGMEFDKKDRMCCVELQNSEESDDFEWFDKEPDVEDALAYRAGEWYLRFQEEIRNTRVRTDEKKDTFKEDTVKAMYYEDKMDEKQIAKLLRLSVGEVVYLIREDKINRREEQRQEEIRNLLDRTMDEFYDDLPEYEKE